MRMAGFASEVKHFMGERGMSLRQLAKAAGYDASYLSKVLNGKKPYSAYMARCIDDALGAEGKIRAAAQEAPPWTAGKVRAAGRKPSKAVEALQVSMADDPAGPDIGGDGLAELVLHYAYALAVRPSAAVYDELILALAAAGLGELDQAAATGAAALECGRVVWPTLVLAGKLDQSLAWRFPRATHATDFHERYIDASARLTLSASHPAAT